MNYKKEAKSLTFCRGSEVGQENPTRPAQALPSQKQGFGVPYFNTFFLKEPTPNMI